MNLFFWQNCISPHQVPYIRRTIEDSRVDKVFLIAPRIDYEERKNMGWDAGAMLGDVDIEWCIAPPKRKIDELMAYEPDCSVHLFSGIRGDYETFQFFLQSLNHKLRRGFIQEPPYTYDKPLWMHYIRFFLQDRKFISKFDYVFAIGEDAVTYYRNWSKRWKVIPFVYCTEKPCIYAGEEIVHHGGLSMIFVGSLSKRKNVMVLLKAIHALKEPARIKLDIYGDGEQRAMLEDYVAKNGLVEHVALYGKVGMDEVGRLMQLHDVLVLPSLYDGWGAVVNEALMSGLYCVCSDKCGARLLLKSEERGLIFRNDDYKDLKHKIEWCTGSKEQLRKSVSQRRRWSGCIEGRTVAKYMIDNLVQEELVPQPWL